MTYAVLGYWVSGYTIGDILDASPSDSTGTSIGNSITQIQELSSDTSSGTSTSSSEIIIKALNLSVAVSTAERLSTSDTIYQDITTLVADNSTQDNNTPAAFASVVKWMYVDHNYQIQYCGIPITLRSAVSTQTGNSSVSRISKDTKLQVLFSNVADTAIISSNNLSIAGFSIENLKSENKGLIWRVSGSSCNIELAWSTPQVVSCIALPISNLNSDALIRVRTYSDTAGTFLISDSGFNHPIPGTQSSVPINQFMYKSTSIARSYIPRVSNVQKVVVDISNTTPQGFIEISRIICGDTWVPKYGTSYGVQIASVSDSSHSRTHSGNIYTDRGSISKTLSFDLGYLTVEDRDTLLSILKTNGISKPVFISVFPNSENPSKEQLYTIYGKISSTPTLNNPIYNMYNTSLSIESI